MSIPTEMSTEASMRMACSMRDWIRVLQFGDSTLPTGAFSFSHGLESAIEWGLVHDASTLRDFVRTSIEQSAACDGVALLIAHEAASAGWLDKVATADQCVFNRKLNEEMRLMTVRTGKKLMAMAGRVVPETPLLSSWLGRVTAEATPGTYPVCLAVVFAALRLPAQSCFIVQEYSVAMAILSAALRLMRVDHFDTQGILFQVNGEIESAYAQAAQKGLEDMATYAPAIDVLAATHVKAHVRLFMS
ncbi:MAG: urease accessory protein UreF [Holophaga sp.]|nr:urease accessory protein UreF [Holophaga sp.]